MVNTKLRTVAATGPTMDPGGEGCDARRFGVWWAVLAAHGVARGGRATGRTLPDRDVEAGPHTAHDTASDERFEGTPSTGRSAPLDSLEG